MLHFRKSKHKMLPCFTSVFFSPDNLGAITSSEQDHEYIKSKGDWSRSLSENFAGNTFEKRNNTSCASRRGQSAGAERHLTSLSFFVILLATIKRSGKDRVNYIKVAICRRANCDVRATMNLDWFKILIVNVKDPSPPPKAPAIC